MSTRTRRLASRTARLGIRRFGESAKRIRPVESKVHGQTVKDLDSDVRLVSVVIAARSGRILELGWGQAAAGEHYAVVEPSERYEVGDLIDPEAGAWEGERFRVTFVDRLTSTVALELVTEANA